MAQKVIFKNQSIQILKNSFIFGISNIIRNLGVFIISNVLLILLLLLPKDMGTVVIVILIILGGAYSLLISHLNSLAVIEKYMDREKYKSVYHKGLSDFYEEDHYA